MAAGGKYLHDAMTTIDMIRKFKCTLRIQVWHMGADEMHPAAQSWFTRWVEPTTPQPLRQH
jgi:hypothetical protein